MNELLKRLSVPERVRSFFSVQELLFDYGGQYEYFEFNFHYVPTTSNLWLAGKDIAAEVILTGSVMEAIAYLSVNHTRYSDLERLVFISLGNLPYKNQLDWIRSSYPRKKFALVFSKDILGRLTEIKIAAGLKNGCVQMNLAGNAVHINFNNKLYAFEQEGLSLSVFEKATGLRTGFRAPKPKEFDTYLDQLKHDAFQ